MPWEAVTDFIDFYRLLAKALAETNKTAVSRGVHRDRTVVERWQNNGGRPDDLRDAGRLVAFALNNEIDLEPYQTWRPIYDLSAEHRYEQSVAESPPDLSWLTKLRLPDSWNRYSLAGIPVDTPIGLAASPLTADDSWLGLGLGLGYGFSTMKTRRSGARVSWEPPHIAYPEEIPALGDYDPSKPPIIAASTNRRPRPGVPNLLNSIGVPSEAPADWESIYERIKSLERGAYVGLSVLAEGETPREALEDLRRVLSIAANLRPPFIEVNVSCPNREAEHDALDADLDFREQVCKVANKLLAPSGILLRIKLPYVRHPELRHLMNRIGGLVQGVAYRNTIKVRAVRKDRNGQLVPIFFPREFAGLSGPATYSMTRSGVAHLASLRRQMGHEYSIIAIGGISTATEVAGVLSLGADLVECCTAAIFDPFLAWKTFYHLRSSTAASQPDDWFPLQPRDRNEIKSWNEFTAAMTDLQKRQVSPPIPVTDQYGLWNAWLLARRAEPQGEGRKFNAPIRTRDEWLHELLALGRHAGQPRLFQTS